MSSKQGPREAGMRMPANTCLSPTWSSLINTVTNRGDSVSCYQIEMEATV
jgi:hypothetical protein